MLYYHFIGVNEVLEYFDKLLHYNFRSEDYFNNTMDVNVLKQEIADHQTCLDELISCKNELAIANQKLELVSKKYNVNLCDNSLNVGKHVLIMIRY